LKNLIPINKKVKIKTKSFVLFVKKLRNPAVGVKFYEVNYKIKWKYEAFDIYVFFSFERTQF
jgi:hypothetical protein